MVSVGMLLNANTGSWSIF